MEIEKRGIGELIAVDRRPPVQVGGDIDYAQVTRGVRNLLLGVIIVVGALVGLSVFVKVEEVARARGDFVPVERIQVIQTPEGGALEQLLVRNDDRVKKGDVIAKFRATDLLRDLALSDVRAARLQIEIERLDALAAGRTPDVGKFKDKFPGMVAEALALHQEQVRRIAGEVNQRDRQIDQVRANLAATRNQLASTKSAYEADVELLERIREGAKSGVVARNRVAQAEEANAQAERAYRSLLGSIEENEARIKSLEAERESVLAKSAGDARTERAERIEQMRELEATLAAFRSRSSDIEVKSPISGIVQKISETPIGTVIPAGGTVCEIVPTEGGVLMQARVAPRDIGFVLVGQKVIVKVDAFDYGRFGAIAGKVVRIAPSSTPGPPGQPPFFQVEVELAQPYVGSDKTHVVTPGMTGEATILTGQKTIFQYLLKPIYLGLDTALHER